ncbi:PREDICTED: stimulated by retinoic acid gene 8 protein [Chrysochloris asiatica]|uniref:Stimulated by retinoic acid gene 8 protein n=1 Tax=Chrysochloris asiatica TaxID=185453 RepID=A0A9B0TCI5_CHRAS|nr:PREDICTED: stimulated by retinoic acid gene 8 protein [Chrysochloris asiatica]
MKASQKHSNPSGRVTATRPQTTAQPPELEPRVARRRLSQARHRATLTELFNNLKKIVYSKSNFIPSKWQVLNKAKSHIQNLELTLDIVLKLKDYFNLEDGNARTLEEVKREYARLYSKDFSMNSKATPEKHSSWYLFESVKKEEDEEEEEDQEEEEEEEGEEEKNRELVHSSGTLSPDLLEFERYLTFYKQMMGLLTDNGVISSQEVTLPIVSAAISHLWQNLSEARKTILLQFCVQMRSSFPEASQEPAFAEGSGVDSGVDSQGASCSLASTPEEVLFEDAFDVTSLLDKSEVLNTSSASSLAAGCHPESAEKFQFYIQIIEVFKDLFCENTQSHQEPTEAVDDELAMLRCMETFEDEGP